MLSRKLRHLEEALRKRGLDRQPLTPTELLQAADVLHSLLLIAEQLEDKPVPPAFRLIRGGLDLGGAA